MAYLLLRDEPRGHEDGQHEAHVDGNQEASEDVAVFLPCGVNLNQEPKKIAKENHNTALGTTECGADRAGDRGGWIIF